MKGRCGSDVALYLRALLTCGTSGRCHQYTRRRPSEFPFALGKLRNTQTNKIVRLDALRWRLNRIKLYGPSESALSNIDHPEQFQTEYPLKPTTLRCKTSHFGLRVSAGRGVGKRTVTSAALRRSRYVRASPKCLKIREPLLAAAGRCV